jgi:hypothetical protein
LCQFNLFCFFIILTKEKCRQHALVAHPYSTAQHSPPSSGTEYMCASAAQHIYTKV